jgi:hypothetical protein
MPFPTIPFAQYRLYRFYSIRFFSPCGSIWIMLAIEGYIGDCHPENSSVDRGVSQGQEWNSSRRDDLFQCKPLLQALFIIIITLKVVKLNYTQQIACLLWSLCQTIYGEPNAHKISAGDIFFSMFTVFMQCGPLLCSCTLFGVVSSNQRTVVDSIFYSNFLSQSELSNCHENIILMHLQIFKHVLIMYMYQLLTMTLCCKILQMFFS